MGWLIVAVPSREGSASSWLVYLLAAMFVGFAGLTSARLQGGAASVYTGVALLPLVPGYAIYQGMLALTLGTGNAARPLKDAAVISLSIAAGVAVGLALGRNTFLLLTWLRFKSRRVGARVGLGDQIGDAVLAADPASGDSPRD